MTKTTLTLIFCIVLAFSVYANAPERPASADETFGYCDPILGPWPTTDLVSWTQMPDATATFRRAASGCVGNYWYSFGDQYLHTAHAFNLNTLQWEASTPPPSTGPTCNWPGVTTDEALYTIGGYNPGYLNNVQKFTPTGGGPTGTWTQMAPFPRAACGIAAAWDGGDYIYAAGGNPTPATSAYRYSISGNSWSTIANMPDDMNYCGGAFAGGKFHVIGGISNSNTHYAYDPVTDTWSSAASVPVSLDFATFSVSDDPQKMLMYSIGGGGGYGSWPATNAVQVYDPGTDIWTQET
ncbi:MAG: Kelch repeat-containing protein, partial [Planctomycetota bacterium]